MKPLIMGLVVCILALSLPSDAVSLEISGHSTGTGLHNLTFLGDLLDVSIQQGNASDFWRINVTALEAS